MKTATTAQLNNIILDTGVVYLNYGAVGERILAPTTGGNSFEVKQEIRLIERDGALGKEKGMRRVVKEEATLKVQLLDLSIANCKLALAGATATSTAITSTTTGAILSTEYLTNVTFIGTDLEGKNKIITLYNAMADNGMKIVTKDKDEPTLELQFSAHRDPTDSAATFYKIEEVNDIAPDLTALSVTTATLAPAFIATTYGYGANVIQSVASVTATPTCAAATSLKVNGTVVASGAASGAIALTTGINTITVTVFKDGKTNKTYTITINKTVA